MITSSKKNSNRRQPKASKQPRVTCDELVIEPIISQDDIVIEKPKLKRSPRKSKLVEELSSIPIDVPISIEETVEQPIVFSPDEDTLQDIPATFVDDVPDVTPVVDTVECPCGSIVSKKGLSKHLKSKKHLAWVAQQEALTVPGC